MEPAVFIAIVGALGIGSQWIAWRLQLPAIVLMLAAGIIAGPVLGLIDPEQALGDLFRPLVSIAVALILFEGGMTLNFAGLRDARPAVRQLVFIGAPLGWLMSSLAVHYGAGLSWESSIVFGGILIVTGPTVITPMLRQAKLSARPASVLRWEAIVNDPVGAMFAVLAFEVIATFYGAETPKHAIQTLVVGIVLASIIGYVSGWVLVRAFHKRLVPEYMKVPLLFGTVISAYAFSDMALHESGLLAVTIMGVYIGNAHLPSLDEIKRFKEHVTILLVSGVFILLAASLDRSMLSQIDMRAAFFVALIVFVARPVTVLISLIGTDLSKSEKTMIAWIGPRGVVAVAVSSLFGARLVELGVLDGIYLQPLAFALVTATVILHGFSITPLAKFLHLTSTKPPGVLVVGASDWSVNLALALEKMAIPMLIAEPNWFKLRAARRHNLKVYHGEIMSEAAEHTIDLHHFDTILAATDNDAYNALVCTDFGPEFGRTNVYQIGRHETTGDYNALPVTLGGRTFGNGLKYEEIEKRYAEGWRFKTTQLSEEYSFEHYYNDRSDATIIAFINSAGMLDFIGSDHKKYKTEAATFQTGHVLAMVSPKSEPEPEIEHS